MRIRAILNRRGGTLRTTDMVEFCARAQAIFTSAGHELDFRIVVGKELAAALDEAGRDARVEAIIAGGGDGTISAAAAAAYASGKPLGVLPAGTMNLFARALHMPLDLDMALRAIAQGTVSPVDIATANGRPFVHQFSVGIHARLVRIRNGMKYRTRLGKKLASLRAIAAAMINPPRFAVDVDDGKQNLNKTVSGIAVTNNPLDNAPIPVADRLDTGQLGVYIADTVGTRDLLKLAFDVVIGRWRANPQVTEMEASTLTLKFPKRKRDLYAVIDGELVTLERAVKLEMQAGALNVILPGPDWQDEAGAPWGWQQWRLGTSPADTG